MHGNRLLHRVRRLLVALLMLSVAANGTQAVVLCAGRDGRVAVEMAGHHHCHSEHESEETRLDSKDGENEPKTPCLSCVDTPLSPGIPTSPITQKTPAKDAFFAGTAPYTPEMTNCVLDAFLTARAGPAYPSFHDPLSSIILIV